MYAIAFSWPNPFKGALWKKDERFDGKHGGSSRDSATKTKTWAEGSVVDFCNKINVNNDCSSNTVKMCFNKQDWGEGNWTGCVHMVLGH